MKFSKFYAPTTKEAPKDASLPSHQFLIRGGFVEQIGSGLYNYLPLGKIMHDKISRVVKEEMNEAGALEVSFSVVTSGELWKQSGRYNVFGKELLRFKDRKDNDFVISPTNEEAAVALVRGKVTSYKQLPLNLYQINTKFRDEARPRFGLLRGREFTMKDGYSFHSSKEDLKREFDLMEATYSKIFTRLGLNFRAVEADSGAIGGSGSKEFMVLASNGEDDILCCEACRYAANVEAARRKPRVSEAEAPEADAAKFLTPNAKTIKDVAEFKFFIDNELRGANNMICGANEKDYHFVGVSVSGFNEERFKDLVKVKEGDKCPVCGGNLKLSKGIEVGHIFQLGDKYSAAMNATYLDENGKAKPFLMGCYGIGISRLIAVMIEASHDEKGCIWKKECAPFDVEIIISNLKDEAGVKFAFELYESLKKAGVSVIIDDRNERFGVKMNDFELIGFPYALLVGKEFANGKVEFITRDGLSKEAIGADDAFIKIKESL